MAEAIDPAGPAQPRGRILLLLFLVWLAVIIWRLAEFTIVDRDRFLVAMREESWATGSIPALRGRLLDRSGQPLAWSTRHFQLEWQVPGDAAAAAAEAAQLEQAMKIRLPKRLPLGQHTVVLKDLKPEQAQAIAALQSRGIVLQLNSYFMRNYAVAQPALGHLLGAIKDEDGQEVGISGLEKQHDTLLRGCPGRYRVMIGKTGKWIPETWTEVQKMCPGYDVYLRLSLPSLRQESGR